MRELSIRHLWYVGLRITDLQLIASLQTLTTALYALATHPEYAEVLRDEVEAIINEEGYTKSAMGKMDQLDSFLKEAQRVYGNMGVCESSIFLLHQSLLTIGYSWNATYDA